MSLNLNKAIIAGRMTADPELKTTNSGTSVVSFTVAVNRRFKKEGQPEADFINVVAWQKTAEFVCNYFSKGSSICVEGWIRTRSWTDQNNQKRYATEVIADEVRFVDSRVDSRSDGTTASSDSHGIQDTVSEPHFEELSDEDDIPF